MTTTKKMTKRDHFNALLTIKEVQSNPVLVEFITHELELLDSKRENAKSKMTPQQAENAEICEAILEALTDGTAYTITDMIKKIPACADLSNQRVSALVRGLIEDDKIERFEDKRKAYFRKV